MTKRFRFQQPYGTKRNPKLCQSFCAFLDILGFSELTRSTNENPKESALLLKRLSKALARSRQFNDSETWSGKLWVEKAFTDNLLIAHPFNMRDFPDSLAESEWGSCIQYCMRHQIALFLEGFAVRGGVAVGDLHASRDIVFGAALLEAYELESKKVAEYPEGSPPRVILSRGCLLFALRQSLSYFGDELGNEGFAASPQDKTLLVDKTDSRVFINYLDGALEEDYNQVSVNVELLNQHKSFIEKHLANELYDERIRKKYLWLADYHNHFCRQLGKKFYPELKIAAAPADTSFCKMSESKEYRDLRAQIRKILRKNRG